MEYKAINVSKNKTTITVTLNRPDVHNAMNDVLISELKNCFEELRDNPEVRTIILTGTGKSFCAGADINYMKNIRNNSMEENIRNSKAILDVFEVIYNCPKLVIGRINGHAFGGGLGLLSVCDLNIAVPNSKFAFSEVKLGIIPAMISPYVIERIGPAKARYLFMTGKRFDAEYAREIGLIDFVVPLEELDSVVQIYVDEIQSSGPSATGEVKKLIKNYQEMNSGSFKEYTLHKIAELRASEEGQEGTRAFLEKRKQRWGN